MVIILFLFSKIKLCSFKSLEANSYVHFSMLFIHQHKTEFFSFFVFLIYNDVYFENTQCYKKDCNQKTQRLHLQKTIIGKLALLKEPVIIL